MDAPELWKRYRQYLCRVDSLDLTLDPSWPLADLAVAAFVQDPASLVIVGAARSPVAVQPPAQP